MDLWQGLAGDEREKARQKATVRPGAADISPAMRLYVRRQTVASCAFSEILSSVILLSLALGENISSTAYITHRTGGNIDATYSERVVMTYGIFLFAQLFGLVVSHNILEYKARLQLPKGKKRHVHVAVFEGLSHNVTQAAGVLVTCLRSNFLSMFVERHVHQKAEAGTGREVLLQRTGESCATLLFVDKAGLDVSEGTALRQRIDCALTASVPISVVATDEHYRAVHTVLQSVYELQMRQQLLRVDSLRKGAKPVADQVTAVVDKALERAEAEAEEKKGGSGRGSGRVARTHTVTSRERGLTLSEQRAVERKVEVRGGLAAVMSNR